MAQTTNLHCHNCGCEVRQSEHGLFWDHNIQQFRHKEISDCLEAILQEIVPHYQKEEID